MAGPRRVTVEEYLELERISEEKHEYCNGVMYPLHGDWRPGMPWPSEVESAHPAPPSDMEPRMSALPKRRLTAEEYLEIERNAEFKSEFYAGEMFAMAGASPEHNRTKENLIGELFTRFKGGPCQTFSSDQRVRVENSRHYVYPDIVIVCGKPEFDPLDRNTLTNPVAIIEVLSPGTEKHDTGLKRRQYGRLPSLVEYIVVAQESPLIERFFRLPDGHWTSETFEGVEATLKLTAGDVSIPLADIYARVTFPDPSAESA